MSDAHPLTAMLMEHSYPPPLSSYLYLPILERIGGAITEPPLFLRKIVFIVW